MLKPEADCTNCPINVTPQLQRGLLFPSSYRYVTEPRTYARVCRLLPSLPAILNASLSTTLRQMIRPKSLGSQVQLFSSMPRGKVQPRQGIVALPPPNPICFFFLTLMSASNLTPSIES